MQRLSPHMPPQAVGAPQQKSPGQDPMAVVRKVAEGIKTLGAGITGQPVKLLSNYFPITSYMNWSLYQYRVDFSPEEDRISTKRGLLGQHQERLGGYLFDGTMLFSGKRFDPPTFELTSKRRRDDQTVVITVKFTSIIETSDYANIQVFNLLLRSCLRHLKLTLIGRNYYDSAAKIDVANKLQLLPGYKTTISRYEDKIFHMNDRRDNTFLMFLEQLINESNRYNGADLSKHLRAFPTFTSAIVKHLVILAEKDCCQEVDVFTQSLARAAQRLQFLLPKPVIVPMNDSKAKTFLTHIEQVFKESNPALILCVIPSIRGDVYSLIKRKLSINRSVPFQIVLLKNVKKNSMSVCIKIAIQINCKLCDGPWQVSIAKKFELSTSMSDITKALELSPKSLKRKMSDLIQNNTNTEIIKSKFVKYNESSPIAFIDLTIDSLSDVMASRSLNSQITNFTHHNTGIEKTESNTTEFHEPAISTFIDLTADDPPVQTYSKTMLLTYQEKGSDKGETINKMSIVDETGTRRTVILPFAIQQVSTSNKHSP